MINNNINKIIVSLNSLRTNAPHGRWQWETDDFTYTIRIAENELTSFANDDEQRIREEMPEGLTYDDDFDIQTETDVAQEMYSKDAEYIVAMHNALPQLVDAATKAFHAQLKVIEMRDSIMKLVHQHLDVYLSYEKGDTDATEDQEKYDNAFYNAHDLMLLLMPIEYTEKVFVDYCVEKSGRFHADSYSSSWRLLLKYRND